MVQSIDTWVPLAAGRVHPTTVSDARCLTPVVRWTHQTLGAIREGIVVTVVALEATIVTRTPSKNNEDRTVVCTPITSPTRAGRLNRGEVIVATRSRVSEAETSSNFCETSKRRRGKVIDVETDPVTLWVRDDDKTGVRVVEVVLVGYNVIVPLGGMLCDVDEEDVATPVIVALTLRLRVPDVDAVNIGVIVTLAVSDCGTDGVVVELGVMVPFDVTVYDVEGVKRVIT